MVLDLGGEDGWAGLQPAPAAAPPEPQGGVAPKKLSKAQKKRLKEEHEQQIRQQVSAAIGVNQWVLSTHFHVDHDMYLGEICALRSTILNQECRRNRVSWRPQGAFDEGLKLQRFAPSSSNRLP